MKLRGRSLSPSSGAAVTLIGQWLKFTIQAVNLVVLSRLLTPSDFGTYSIVLAITGLAALFGDFGLSSASIQARHVTNQQQTNLFWINVGGGTLLAILMAVFSPTISQFFGDSGLTNVVVVLSVSAILQSCTAQFLVSYSRSMRFADLAIIDVAPQLLGTAAAIVAAKLGLGYWALVVQQLAISTLTLALAAHGSDWHPGMPHKTRMKHLVVFGTNTFGVQIANYITSNISTVIIGRTLGTVAAGQFGKAQQLYRMPAQQIANPLTRVALPALSRYQDDRDRLERVLAKSLRGVLYTIGGLLIIFASTPVAVISVILGSQWIQAATPFAILCIGGYFELIGVVYYWGFLSTGTTGVQLRFTLITRLVMLGLIALGAPYGTIGVSVGYATGLAINCVVLTAWALPLAGMRPTRVLRGAHRPLLISLTAGLVSVGFSALLTPRTPEVSLLISALAWLCTLLLGVLISKNVRKDTNSIIRIVKDRQRKLGSNEAD